MKVTGVLFLVLLVTGLTACGGSDAPATVIPNQQQSSQTTQSPPSPPSLPVLPPAPPSPFPAPTSTTPYYLATQGGIDYPAAIGTSSRHLIVVDPASPTTPFAVEAAGRWVPLAQFDEGQIDSGAGTIADRGVRFLAYWKDRRVYRLDLRRGSWPPAPSTVSTLMPRQLCSPWATPIPDHRFTERSLLLFPGAGADQTCNTVDDRQLAVRLDMAATDPPITIVGEVMDALRGGDGAITGFLVRDGNRIQRVDASLSNPIDLFTVSTSFELAHSLDLAAVLNGHIVFRDGASILAYNLAGASPPIALLSLDRSDYHVSVHAADSDTVYFAVSSSQDDNGRLIRVTSALTAEVLATETISIIEIFVSPTRVVFGVGALFHPWDCYAIPCYQYRSVPKSGGTAITLVTDNSRTVIGGAGLAGENLWVAALTHSAAPVKNWVKVIRSDGLVFPDIDQARIVNVTHANPMPMLPNSSTVQSITIAHNASASTVSATSAILRTYDGASRAELFEHGSVPLGQFFGLFSAGNPQWGLPSLLTAETTGSSAPLDIFFYQSNAEGLTRVTTFVP
jgi:hypothetical protein